MDGELLEHGPGKEGRRVAHADLAHENLTQKRGSVDAGKLADDPADDVVLESLGPLDGQEEATKHGVEPSGRDGVGLGVDAFDE